MTGLRWGWEEWVEADLPGRALLAPLAQPLVVDKSPVAGLSVLEVKLAVFIPEQGVIAGENLGSN